MHYRWLSVLVCALATRSLASGSAAPHSVPNWKNMHTKHRWNAVPEKWERIGHPPAGTTIDLHIALKPRRENAVIDALYEVSNPKHPKYGAHLSKEQLAELVAPHPVTLKLVESWLEHHGVPPSDVSMSHGGGWLTVTRVPVSKANDLLGASYQLYRHAGTSETILRTVGYALPAALHRHVKTVAPTTYFGSAGTLRQTSRVRRGGAAAALSSRDDSDDGGDDDDDGSGYVDPTFLRWLYNSRTYVPVATGRNVLGVTGFHGQYASYDDLTEFMKRFRSDANDATFTVVRSNGGGFDPNDPGTEANLNMQYAQGIAWPTPHIFYSIGGLPKDSEFIPDSHQPVKNNEPWLEWLNHMLSMPSSTLPQTISTSYGGNEQTFPPDYAKSVCELFARLGLLGVSLLFSSGDDGVGAGDCKKNDGSGIVEFQPVFPSTCPWVTSVGGTIEFEPEVGASLSSGGFSNIFKRPPYQAEVVPSFFKRLGDQYAGLYNDSSRGFPDIAAQAFDYAPIVNNDISLVDGTSCSAPVVAGIISLLNDYRLSQKMKPLGFLNIWLYGRGRQGLNDIISGSNPGCGTVGFTAVPGWDPVTGLGTPDFLKLLDRLPDP